MLPSDRKIVSVVVAVVVVLSMVGPAAAVSTQSPDAERYASTTTSFTATSSNEFINTSEETRVWKRSGLPLRTDTSAGVTTLDVPDTFVNITELENAEGSLNKRTVAVYNTSSSIPITFKSRTGADTSQFANDDVQLLVARMNDRQSSDLDDGSSNFTLGEAVDRLIGENLTADSVNRNFTFTNVQSATLDGNGAASFSASPDAPGHYVFLLARNTSGSGFTVADGNVSLDGNADIIGVDSAPVQSTSPTAAPKTDEYPVGSNITFEVDSGLGASNVDHTVLLVDESKLADQSSTVTVEGALNENLSSDNVTINHSIERVHGVANMTGSTEVMGVTVGDQQVTNSPSVASIIDFLANAANATSPSTTSGDAIVNASVTTVTNASASSRVTVDTLDNWSTGTYTYVYVASTSNSTKFSTSEGSVYLAPEEIQLQITANRTSLTVGQAVQLTVTRLDTNEPVQGAEVVINGQTYTTDANGQVVVRIDTAGEFRASVGKSSTLLTFLKDRSRKIKVKQPQTSAPPAAGGGGGGQQTEEDADAETIPTETGATVNVRNAQAGSRVRVPVTNIASDTAAVTEVEFEMQFSNQRFRVEFTKPTAEPPEGTPAVPSDGRTAVQYFRADAFDVRDSDFGGVNFTFTLKQSALPEGISPSEVRLFRYHNGEWQTLPTRSLGNGQYVARSPGFSAFAIGYEQQQQQQTTTAAPKTTTPGPTTTPAPETTTRSDKQVITTPAERRGFPTSGILLVLVIVVALAALAVYRRRME